MPFKIQRVPRLLNNLLSISGGNTPIELEERVRPTLDLMQLYGAPQRQLIQTTNGALTEGTALTIPAASITAPFLLYGMSIAVTKTATMTALRAAVWLGIPPAGYRIYGEELGPFGATDTGVIAASFYAPYPILLPQTTGLFATLDVIGTDANAAATLSVDIALLP